MATENVPALRGNPVPSEAGTDLRDNLARDIAEGLATGNPKYPVRTPAHATGCGRAVQYTPLLDVVSEAIGAPSCPILKALLALLAGGLKSSDPAQVERASAALQAISTAHVDAQVEAAIEDDADAAPLFVPSPWSRAARIADVAMATAGAA